jgi:hypothetical protein
MAQDDYVYRLANTRVDRPIIEVGDTKLCFTNSLARRVAEHRLAKEHMQDHATALIKLLVAAMRAQVLR